MQMRAVLRGGLGFRPAFAGVRLKPQLFREILIVGVMGSLTTITANVTILLVTGLVGRFGTAAIAGYGIVVRLEFMVAPVAFGIGTGATTLVGLAAGAGDWRRAMRAAWIGGGVAFLIGGAMGWTAALLPESWAGLFASQRDVVDAAVACLTRVAPFYCLFALGLALNFASQGAARMALPVVAGVIRLLVATVGAWLAVEMLGLGLDGIFIALAVSFAIYGGLIAGSLLAVPWRSRRYRSGIVYKDL
jgi:Na+-driven multidrug efflux pump